MESKGVPTPARVYQDFEPSMEWVPEDDSDTLLVYLPGFAKEQLRVQLRARNLIISGERKLQQTTWSRFRVEFPVSINCDLNKISAKFEGSILFVRQPKLITPQPNLEQEKPPTFLAPEPKPQKTANESNVGQKTADESNVGQKTTDESNVGQKTADESNMENKEAGKEQDVPKTELNDGKASESKNVDGVIGNVVENRQVVYEKLDRKTKKALENYKLAVGRFAMKLNMSRNAVNTIVILLVGLVIGVYVSGSIKNWRKV